MSGAWYAQREDLADSEWVAGNEEVHVHWVPLQPAEEQVWLVALRQGIWSAKQVSQLFVIHTPHNSVGLYGFRISVKLQLRFENQNVVGKSADRYNYDALKINEEYNVAVRTQFHLESAE